MAADHCFSRYALPIKYRDSNAIDLREYAQAHGGMQSATLISALSSELSVMIAAELTTRQRPDRAIEKLAT
jgi:hypothetical protein